MPFNSNSKLVEKEFFRLIPENYCILSAEYTIIAATNYLLTSLGIKEEEIVGLSISDVFEDLPESIGATLKEEVTAFDILSRKQEATWNITFTPVLTNEQQLVFCKITRLTGTNETKISLLRNIANSFPGIIALYNSLTGEYLYINQSVEAILGYKSEDFLSNGLPFTMSLVHPDDVTQLKEENFKALSAANEKYPGYDDNKVISFEYRLKSKNDDYKWLRTYGIVYQRTKDHQVELILNVSLDITERKEQELKIEQSEKRLSKHSISLEERLKEEKQELAKKEAYFHFMSDAIPGIVWTSQPNGHNDYYSRRWEEYTGISSEEAIAGNWADVLHPDDYDSTFETMKKSMETGEEYKTEHRLRSKNGNYRWFIARALPLKDKDGKIIKWFGTSFDIDDEKKVLEQLKESRSKYKFLADSIPQLIYTSNATGAIDYLNKKWYEYTGIPKDNLEISSMKDIVHPEDYELLENAYFHSIKSGEIFNIEFRLKKYTGEYRWFLGRAIPMKNDKGDIVKWFGASTDIQEQKETIEHLAEAEKRLSKINHELSKKNDELSKINNDLDNFIYTASHDLKAPISNIEGLISFLKSDDFYKNPEIKEVMDLMEKSTDRFKKTIAGLTDVAKIQKTFNEDTEEIDIEELIKEILPDIPEYKKTDTRIEMNLPITTLKFSKKNMRSILYNLIGNAIKYKSPHREPRLKITTKDTDRFTVLSIEDNGMGIEKENQEKIFKMFKRLHTHIEGTGVGLYIVKRIMDNSDGKIEIESKPGLGTTFLLYFRKT